MLARGTGRWQRDGSGVSKTTSISWRWKHYFTQFVLELRVLDYFIHGLFTWLTPKWSWEWPQKGGHLHEGCVRACIVTICWYWCYILGRYWVGCFPTSTLLMLHQDGTKGIHHSGFLKTPTPTIETQAWNPRDQPSEETYRGTL